MKIILDGKIFSELYLNCCFIFYKIYLIICPERLKSPVQDFLFLAFVVLRVNNCSGCLQIRAYKVCNS